MEKTQATKVDTGHLVNFLSTPSAVPIVAAGIGIERELILGWKNERKVPNVEELFALANHFDCTMDYLVGRLRTPFSPLLNGGEPIPDLWNDLNEEHRNQVLELIGDLFRAEGKTSPVAKMLHALIWYSEKGEYRGVVDGREDLIVSGKTMAEVEILIEESVAHLLDTHFLLFDVSGY